MAWQVLAAQGGMAALKFMGARRDAKIQRQMQAYQNKMKKIAGAINQDSITQNQTWNIQDNAKKSVYMQSDELSSVGASTVSAAAAGVRGNSVNLSVMSIQRDASLLQKNREDDLDKMFAQAHNQRRGAAMNTQNSLDMSYIPKPSFAAHALKAGVQAAATYYGGKYNAGK